MAIGTFLFSACKSTRPTEAEEAEEESDEIILYVGDVAVTAQRDDDWEEEEEQDSPVIFEAPVYKGSETRKTDLIHTSAQIRFDWEKKQAHALATLSLTAYRHPVDTVYLDAKAMLIHFVGLGRDTASATELQYEYDGEKLAVILNKPLTHKDTQSLVLTYTARPEEVTDNGGVAITSEKGLFFINADGSEKNKSRQIWTQGEIQSTSCWLPTIDAPNEKMTHELFITVHDTLTTASNGELLGSTKNGELRTDHWSMKKPHAPYLVAMVIGQFHIGEDSWRGIPVRYFVDEEYAGSCMGIFGNTPEMMEFFSNKLNYPYPWPKYDQAVVYDYVSGAMENTTLTVHGGMLRLKSRELYDEEYEDVIAHELFHHWFGDLVTCESWGQLPLNESFATYGEYLWREHKYGRDDADEHLYHDLQQYLAEAMGKQEKLIRTDFDSPEDMFDAHSYQKGGLTLHMLRCYLGDEDFFDGLNLYLERHAFGTAEIHDLRQAFEEVSGQDLTWFFDQWFFRAGHPMLKVEHNLEWNDDPVLGNYYSIKVDQEVSVSGQAPFRLPVQVVFVYENRREIKYIEIDEVNEYFLWELEEKPLWVGFDAQAMILGRVSETRDEEGWLAQLKHAKTYRHRLLAMEHLAESEEILTLFEAVAIGLTDPHYSIRNKAMEQMKLLSPDQQHEFTDILIDNAKNHPKAATRAAAFIALALDPVTNLDPAIQAGLNDSSYRVNASALRLLYAIQPDSAIAISKKWAYSESEQLRYNALSLLAKQQEDYTDIFLDQWYNEDGERFYLVAMVNLYLKQNDNPDVAFKLLDAINGFEPEEEFEYFTVMFIQQCNSQVKSKWSQKLEALQEEQKKNPTPEREQEIQEIERLLSIVMELH